jgi:hypothetical protein
MGQRIGWKRRWFSRRAIVFHLLLLVIVPGCLVAGWWQVHRAMQGNLLSYGYAVEWPIFAIAAVVGWWQLIMEDPADVEGRRQERIRRAQPRKALLATPELLAANQAALERHRAQLPAPEATGGDLAVIERSDGALVRVEQGDDLASYNAYLATLATRGRSKTWRNPRGMPAVPRAGGEGGGR